MAENEEARARAKAARESYVHWLVGRTGITAIQAHELIDLLGTANLASLVREALLLLKK
ncbi:hypothetical protein RFM68_33130 [Mesorhizobium sp. MSK_1335]|uniref:Uncharacterized protein n=1 Tax=Mesorhizobium montanum TaxID=3072323 RepID=A0ABU4ZV39_9HYPH|nr:hypothetical protein [Mesorhizobium sp. MSK_1335]MDX8529277.1 hypothetical protein [Mesorhizobium sp. MSK_1335]